MPGTPRASAIPRTSWQNLASFGVLALEFTDPADYERLGQDDVLVLDGIREAIAGGTEITVHNATRDEEFVVRHRLSDRQVSLLLAGGLIPWLRQQAA